MQTPLHFRKGLPFFTAKTEKSIQADPYERYDPMVLRQSALHLCDDLWGHYPMQAILDLTKAHIDSSETQQILEVGCSVGRMIANLAQERTNTQCWGLDYSYQLLKQAKRCWLDGEDSHLNLARYGFSSLHQIEGKAIENLNFGLANAEQLPFDEDTQDLVICSFLIDRLDDPVKGLQEIFRVLKQNGKLILVSPQNFAKGSHWQKFYPAVKLSQLVTQIGFSILDWQDEMIIEEPLDRHGNCVMWKCLAACLQKK